MDHWTSLSEIIKEFDLSEGSSLQEVRSDLLRLLKRLHPDHTAGAFPDADTEAPYYKALSAYQRLEQMQHASMSVVPYAERAVAHWTPPKVDIRADEIILRTGISKAAELKYRATKIRSAAIALAITTSLAFPGKLFDNPVVSNLLTYLDAQIPVLRPVIEGAFVLGILSACVAFFAAWKRETQAKVLSEEILTEPKIYELLTIRLKSSIGDNGVFSFNDLVDAIKSEADFTQRSWVEWMPPKVTKKLAFSWRYRKVTSLFESDVTLAQQAAELIIAKLELRQAISPTAAGGLRREFQLSSVALDQLNENGRNTYRKKAPGNASTP